VQRLNISAVVLHHVNRRALFYLSIVLDPICNMFFDELSDVLLRLTVLDVPVIVTGDINIHLECHDDTHSSRFTELLPSY